MARAKVQDFINEVNAAPGCDAVLNPDGSMAIYQNGVLVWPRVFWNIMWGTVAVGWMSGPCAKDGSTNNTTPSGLCELGDYPTDSVTFVDGGVASTAAAQFFLDNLT
jgi:hypothetical protein